MVAITRPYLAVPGSIPGKAVTWGVV